MSQAHNSVPCPSSRKLSRGEASFRSARFRDDLAGGSENEYWVAPNRNNGWLWLGILLALKESNIHLRR